MAIKKKYTKTDMKKSGFNWIWADLTIEERTRWCTINLSPQMYRNFEEFFTGKKLTKRDTGY